MRRGKQGKAPVQLVSRDPVEVVAMEMRKQDRIQAGQIVRLQRGLGQSL
jgi:hypothetical protein